MRPVKQHSAIRIVETREWRSRPAIIATAAARLSQYVSIYAPGVLCAMRHASCARCQCVARCAIVEQRSAGMCQSIYRLHLEDVVGDKRLDEIGVGEIARLRTALVANFELGERYINNILAVLSKALRYAADCEVIAKAPKVGLFKVERPEIVAWDFAQYARLLAAARADSPGWYVAVCLAGEAGREWAKWKRSAGARTLI